MHARPHIPQWALSVCVSRHVPAHSVWPDGHDTTQRPAVQIWPAPQALSHIPQCSRSVWRSRHTEPHTVSPVEHETAHVPDAHT